VKCNQHWAEKTDEHVKRQPPPKRSGTSEEAPALAHGVEEIGEHHRGGSNSDSVAPRPCRPHRVVEGRAKALEGR